MKTVLILVSLTTNGMISPASREPSSMISITFDDKEACNAALLAMTQVSPSKIVGACRPLASK